ncbi:MAG: hypothetical protein ACYDBQ_11555 [Thermoplasmatota archaeon]
MAVVFDAAVIIRAASGGLQVLLGLAILVVGRRRPGSLALGLFLASFGGVILFGNLTDMTKAGNVSLQTACAAVAALAGVAQHRMVGSYG